MYKLNDYTIGFYTLEHKDKCNVINRWLYKYYIMIKNFGYKRSSVPLSSSVWLCFEGN